MVMAEKRYQAQRVVSSFKALPYVKQKILTLKNEILILLPHNVLVTGASRTLLVLQHP